MKKSTDKAEGDLETSLNVPFALVDERISKMGMWETPFFMIGKSSFIEPVV